MQIVLEQFGTRLTTSPVRRYGERVLIVFNAVEERIARLYHWRNRAADIPIADTTGR